MAYYIGLDNGGTKTKASLFDSSGKQIAVCSIATSAITPQADFVECDMEDMWRANCHVLKTLLKETGISSNDISGIGVCGHGKGLYLWGKDNKPVRNGIISTDNRAYSYVDRWKKDGTEERVFDISYQHIMSCQPVALLAWLKDNEEENYKNIKYVFECKDYIRFRLTGEARAEITDYSGSNFMNLNSKTYDKDLLELFGISEVWEALPPLCNATDVAGYITRQAAELTGLKEGTPVVGGFFDINATAIASGINDEDCICMVAGTWSINEYIRTTPVLNGTIQMNSLFCLPGYYLIEESSATGAGNNEWFIRQLLPELVNEAKEKGLDIYEVVDKWVENISPMEFIPVFLPFLMASNVHANARACFIGLNISHTRKHMARSVFEGITFSHRYHFEKLMATREKRPSVIRLSGGASKAKVWAQMFADVMQIQVETVEATEVGALGCAMAAAVATGEYADLDEAIKNMLNISQTAKPNVKLQDIYNKKYVLYCKAMKCLDSLWDDMQNLMIMGENKQ